MLQFISLASGSSGNCYYLSHNGNALLIDLGIGIRLFKRSCSNYGLKQSDIRAILVTHDHTDHVKAVGVLSQQFHLPVYTSERVHQSICSNHFVSKKVPELLRRNIRRGVTFTINDFEITSFAVPHDSADNNGYIIRVAGKQIVILTDVGHFTEEMKAIVHDATHLVIESNYDRQMLEQGHYPQRLKMRISGELGHISNEETAQFLAENISRERIEKIWLCHLSAENNTPEKAYNEVKNALAPLGYIVEGTEKNLHLEALARRTPSLLYDLSDE